VKYARAASISVAFAAAPIAACPRWVSIRRLVETRKRIRHERSEVLRQTDSLQSAILTT
jgi:hypothetical protein